jgi:hypothetical protein
MNSPTKAAQMQRMMGLSTVEFEGWRDGLLNRMATTPGIQYFGEVQCNVHSIFLDRFLTSLHVMYFTRTGKPCGSTGAYAFGRLSPVSDAIPGDGMHQRHEGHGVRVPASDIEVPVLRAPRFSIAPQWIHDSYRDERDYSSRQSGR